ncbi:helix-turn-helix transcriptional regulator [Lelliottia wanjuensis]|uniref:helix-turn-helix transcriptional regulator n=1 Tax=Lelliottia wanjuensis TaxID=3050585 RepID=UPI00254CB4B0|nr:helix-turn-helix domain-containing protein [Lelliottia sp. V86_10]MDK9585729.1 helix-turn-helix domain-containing protein [Lelliottia sp. V86_10]
MKNLLPSENRFISTKELAELLGLKPQTIRKQISDDRLPEGISRPKKVGRLNRWPLKEIIDYLSSN